LGSCVLIVDDDADLSETLARLLGRFGHRCLVAASGSEAIELIDGASPDLVVADLHTAGTDGLAVTRRARQKHPPIPVVLMTRYPMAEAAPGAGMASGIVRLAKPFANAEVLDAVERALNSRKSVMAGRPARI
jgi:CheY-like chemotaxis protein